MNGRRRRPVAAIVLVVAIGCSSCATLPPAQPAGAGVPANGSRALYRGLLEGPGGRDRFKVAVAIRPPDRLRLEFFSAVGGPRYLLAASGDRLVALDLAEHVYEESPATAGAVDRLLGLPLTPARVIAVFTGAAPGPLRDPEGGAIILAVDYGDDVARAGRTGPGTIRIDLPERATRLTLEAVEGPMGGDLPDALFAPEIPEGWTAGAPGAARPLAAGRAPGPE